MSFCLIHALKVSLKQVVQERPISPLAGKCEIIIGLQSETEPAIYSSFLSTHQENNYSRIGVKMTQPRYVCVYLLDTQVCTYKIKRSFR